VPVAQPVEDEFDEFPGGGDLTDVPPAALSDLVADSAQATVFVGALDGFDRGPAHQPRSLLGDPPAVHRGIGLMVLRGQPGPAGQLRCPAESAHLADLGDEHRGQDRPPPRRSPGWRCNPGVRAAGHRPGW
jgi:hypothetical protein